MGADAVPVGASTDIEGIGTSTEIEKVGVIPGTEIVRFHVSGATRMDFISGNVDVALGPDGYSPSVTSPLVLDSLTVGRLDINTLL